MAIIRELITKLGFTIDDAEARRYNKMLSNLGTKLRRVGRTMSLFVTAPIVALGGSFIKVAADAEETESKFKEVFSSIKDEADATAKALSKDFDLANTSAQEMLSTTGDILVGFGFTEKAALDLSSQVNSLAVDIASFKNVQGGAAQASNAITKALLGEREMLKGIGIAILEEDVKLKIAQLTAKGMTFETNRQAKSFATLQLVIDRSTKSIGDYARTSGSATNQARKLRQRWIELSVTLGKVLLPIFTDLVKALSSVVEWFTSFSPAGRKAIVIIAGITAALGPLLIVLGSIVSILAAIPVLTIAAVAAVGALGFLIGEDIAGFLQGKKSVVGLIFESLGKLTVLIENKIRGLINSVMEYLSQTWVGWVAEHIDPWIQKVERLLGLTREGEETTPQEARIRGFERILQFLGVDRPTIDPRLAALRSQSAIEHITRAEPMGGSTMNFSVPITINPAQGMSEPAVARDTADAFERAARELMARGASTPRLAP